MTLTESLDELFAALDGMEVSPACIFKNGQEKEQYESLLTFGFRKLQAAKYHLLNVHRLLAKAIEESAHVEREFTRHLNEQPSTLGKRGLARLSTQISAHDYAFELAAFLAAIKSGVDFIAAAASRHLPGTTADSIRTPLRLVSKGFRGPILNEVAESHDWLTGLREYRHHLVHRLVITLSRGWEVSMTEQGSTRAPYPVVVPVRPPKHVLDTRRERMMNSASPLGLTVTKSTSWITESDGSRRMVSNIVNADPSPGFMRIEDFMKTHIDAFEEFFLRMVRGLIDLKGTPASVVGAAGETPQR